MSPSGNISLKYFPTDADDVEDLERYREGGYHRVCINDKLHERYRVVHKLGYGTYCTAWLAIDEQTSKYVAVKVSTADADRTEVDVLSQLARGATAHGISKDALALIPLVFDSFYIHGPNGNHSCLVTVPAMCSLSGLRAHSTRGPLLQLDTARSLAVQLAKALEIVHLQGYAHGDIHFGNILLQLSPPLDGLSTKQLYSRYGKPSLHELTLYDSAIEGADHRGPSHVVSAVRLSKQIADIGPSEAKLILNDFGLAFRPSEKTRFRSFAPDGYCPPEEIFEPKTPLGFASDIWSLGCTIFELLGQWALLGASGFGPDDTGEITVQLVELQGMMPHEWFKGWKDRPNWYDDNGHPLPATAGWQMGSWDTRYNDWLQTPRQRENMETPSHDERDALLDLLKRMLAWRPSERPDIKKVLESKWMKQWALPAYEKHRS